MVTTLASGHLLPQRVAARDAFNDPDHGSQVLVTSIRISSSSNKFQGASSYVLFVDLPFNANEILQCIGRVFRLGQLLPDVVAPLTINHIYDQIIQGRATNKMIGQIAGQGKVNVSEEEVLDYIRTLSEELAGLVDEVEARQEIMSNECVKLYIQLCGQRSSRKE